MKALLSHGTQPRCIFSALKNTTHPGVVDITIIKALCHCLEQGLLCDASFYIITFVHNTCVQSVQDHTAYNQNYFDFYVEIISEHFLIRLIVHFSCLHTHRAYNINFDFQMESRGQLYECLVNIQSSGSAALSFEVSVLFAKWGMIEERSLVILHKALHGSSSAAQSLVSINMITWPLIRGISMMCILPQALTCLVSNCGCYSSQVISSAIDQMHKLIDWKVCLVRNKSN